MTIDEARKDQIRCQGFRLSSLISKYDAIDVAIAELDKIEHCGSMAFIGKSGRIGEDAPIVRISINSIGGCRAVPILLRELAETQRKEVEAELEKL